MTSRVRRANHQMAKNSAGVSTEPGGKYVLNYMLVVLLKWLLGYLESNIFLCLLFDSFRFCGRLLIAFISCNFATWVSQNYKILVDAQIFLSRCKSSFILNLRYMVPNCP